MSIYLKQSVDLKYYKMDKVLSSLNLTNDDMIGVQISLLLFVPYLLGHFLFPKLTFQFGSLVLACCGGLTVGFSLNSHSSFEEKIADCIFSVVIMLLALSALHNNSKKPMMVGYILHGTWDILHHHWTGHLHVAWDIKTTTPLWYPLSCFTYDFLVAAMYMVTSYPSSGGNTAQKKKTR
ncbi:hypothetical protein PPL_07174 [Heterostelium album PN500]|uniref:Transmembrane protein n=1 Tax=Heterostelium pallidum (strain ATCC 26659 / Pp 5 / PN500) TaxID=670386 RepID=D3BEL0_HETP5|nr:hypothetical protein PPL_07174 [Heterostelium album PN500]EFA80341.1 hypothetical protein PPL_07174 [Heterostelium album PN500]|eukprot:XP_020432461.1 hypothetical protein PPL_07174 [Heterostelium album PN500]